MNARQGIYATRPLKMVKPLKLQVDKKKILIGMPGGSMMLILISLVFFTKYFYGYLYATDPGAAENIYIYMSDIISSGVISGLFVGRAFGFWLHFKAAEHTDLVEGR
jgi:hypothetical protein